MTGEHEFEPGINRFLCQHVIARGCFSTQHCHQTKDAPIHAPTRMREIVEKVMAAPPKKEGRE